MAYASTTTVPVPKTRGEIEALLEKHKATQYMVAQDFETNRAVVQFKIHNRIIRFTVKMPLPKDFRRTNYRGNVEKQRQEWLDQGTRQKWRALLLVLKAKLESIESGIATFEEEFLAFIVLPNDQTVSEVIVPRIAAVYEGGGGLLLPPAGESS